MEQRIVERESSLPYRGIPAAAMRGRSPIALARNTSTLAIGTLAAVGLLRQLRPASILGTGGYVCVPAFLAARMLGIPTLIFLPDVVPGLAVQMLSRIATQVACSVEDSAPFFGKRVQVIRSPVPLSHNGQGGAVGEQAGGQANGGYAEEGIAYAHGRGLKPLLVTGYPVRADLFTLDRAVWVFDLRDDLPVLLVYGGSRGARSINRAIQALLGALLPLTQIIHICGREGDDAWLRETVATLDGDLQVRYRLFPYLESGKRSHATTAVSQQPSMVAALGAADVAVCRSGASILGELPALGLVSVLVPYPYVHQDENADYLVRNGAAVKVADEAMLGDGNPLDGPLFSAITRLVRIDSPEHKTMAARCRSLARDDAAASLAKALLAIRRGRV